MTHDLKTWPKSFQAVWDRRKTAELRKDDRNFKVGDRLLLREYDPAACRYSGRRIQAAVTDCTSDESFGLKAGFVMLSLQPEWQEN